MFIGFFFYKINMIIIIDSFIYTEKNDLFIVNSCVFFGWHNKLFSNVDKSV